MVCVDCYVSRRVCRGNRRGKVWRERSVLSIVRICDLGTVSYQSKFVWILGHQPVTPASCSRGRLESYECLHDFHYYAHHSIVNADPVFDPQRAWDHWLYGKLAPLYPSGFSPQQLDW